MGKSSDVPAPDPRLIDAQIESLGRQNSLIDQIIRNSEEMQPIQREQMEFGLAAQRRAFEQSQADREWMLGRRGQLSGLQDQLVRDARTFNTEARREQLAGEALGDVNQAFGSARDQGMRSMTRMGINPNDGRMAAFNQQTNNQQALAMATAANKVRQAARQEGYALTDRATNALAGYPAMGMQATGQAAGFGTAGLGLANQGLAGMNSGYGLGMQGANAMGNSAANMYGTQANAYNNSQQNDPFASIVGAGLGMFMRSDYMRDFMRSDRRLKTNIVQVGVHEDTGLTLYEFSYTDAPQRRFVGVMADEVLRYDPGAIVYDAEGYAAVDYGRLGIQLQEVK